MARAKDTKFPVAFTCIAIAKYISTPSNHQIQFPKPFLCLFPVPHSPFPLPYYLFPIASAKNIKSKTPKP
jgi:hypothetical protein